MKYFLIGEKIFKSINFPPTYNLSEVLEATPENIQKLNLIPKKERKPFAVGDRVKIYKEEEILIGTIEQSYGDIAFSEWRNVKLESGINIRPHIKQLRRLIPKPKPKAVRVTRELLAKFWNSASAEYADSSEKFKDMCKELGID